MTKAIEKKIYPIIRHCVTKHPNTHSFKTITFYYTWGFCRSKIQREPSWVILVYHTVSGVIWRLQYGFTFLALFDGMVERLSSTKTVNWSAHTWTLHHSDLREPRLLTQRLSVLHKTILIGLDRSCTFLQASVRNSKTILLLYPIGWTIPHIWYIFKRRGTRLHL